MLEGHRVLVTGATGQVARPLAETLASHNEVWAAARFSDPEAKKELEARGIRTARFTLGDDDLSDLPDDEFSFWLTSEIGVAPVPGSSFYSDPDDGRHLARFAFCKTEDLLEQAAERLVRIRAHV